MNDNKFISFSEHFWLVLKKGEKFLKRIPKKTSSTIHFKINQGSQVRGTQLDIVELENILMRLRIFTSKNEPIFIEKLLSDFELEFPETKGEINNIRNNLNELNIWELGMSININGESYRNIFQIIKYILNGELLHSDSEKQKHLDNIFSNKFTGSFIYYEILDWILGYIRYVLFEFDLLIQNNVFKKAIKREEYQQALLKYLEFIDPIEIQL